MCPSFLQWRQNGLFLFAPELPDWFWLFWLPEELGLNFWNPFFLFVHFFLLATASTTSSSSTGEESSSLETLTWGYFGLEVAISVDREFVGNFWDGKVYQGYVVELVPDFFQQSGNEGPDAEQFALIGPACFEHVHMSLVGWIKRCLEGSLLDGVLVLLLLSQISDGSVIVGLVVDVTFHWLLCSVLHFVVLLVDPGVVQSISVLLEEFVPESSELLLSVSFLRENPLVGVAFEHHFEVELGHLV